VAAWVVVRALVWLCCLLSASAPPRDLHSFPTRRSSDLPPSAACPSQETPMSLSCLRSSRSVVDRLSASLASAYAASCRLCDPAPDRKSTRLNSSHVEISYAVFCLKKKKNNNNNDIIQRL